MTSLRSLFLHLLGTFEDYEEEVRLGPLEDSNSCVSDEVYRVPVPNAQATEASKEPLAPEGDLRIYIEELPRDEPPERRFRRIFRAPKKPTEDYFTTGFRAVINQWRGGEPRLWCRLSGYDFFDYPEPASNWHPRMKASQSSQWSLNDLHCVRTIRNLQLEDKGDGHVNAVIICETRVFKAVTGLMLPLHLEDLLRKAESPGLLPPTKRFSDELRALEEMYRQLRTTRNLKQIFLLQVHHAYLNQYAKFLERFTTAYASRRMRKIDPRQSKLRQWILKVIVADSHLYRQFTNAANELVLASESLLDIVLALGGGQDKNELALVDAELRACCKDVTTRLSRLSGDLDHHLQLLSLSRDMSQSRNVQMLTVLATIFLPMSLSAGILSMQTRFKDLEDLLYDFFGVVVLIVTAVVLLLITIITLSFAKELESRFHRFTWYRAFGRRLLLATVAIIALIFGVLVLSSFVVGMLKDVFLGAKILGYGTVVAVGLPITAAVLLLCRQGMARLLRRARGSRGRDRGDQKRNDLEGNADRKVSRPRGTGTVLRDPEDSGGAGDLGGTVRAGNLEALRSCDRVTLEAIGHGEQRGLGG